MSKNPIKHLLIIAITLSLTLFSSVVIYANSQNTISSVTSTVNLGTNGDISIIYRNVAHPSSVEKVVTTTYIEKRTFFSWERINIGTINNEWIDTIHQSIYTSSRLYHLSTPGTYRTTIIYQFYNSSNLISTVKFQSVDKFY